MRLPVMSFIIVTQLTLVSLAGIATAQEPPSKYKKLEQRLITIQTTLDQLVKAQRASNQALASTYKQNRERRAQIAEANKCTRKCVDEHPWVEADHADHDSCMASCPDYPDDVRQD